MCLSTGLILSQERDATAADLEKTRATLVEVETHNRKLMDQLSALQEASATAATQASGDIQVIK